MSDVRWLSGYLDLTGKLHGAIGRRLPLFLAQEYIWRVELHLVVDVPFLPLGDAVWMYTQQGGRVLYWLSAEEASAWSEEVYWLSFLWSSDCLPDSVKLASRTDRQGFARLNFYADGRVLLISWLRGSVERWHAHGQWRQPDVDSLPPPPEHADHAGDA